MLLFCSIAPQYPNPENIYCLGGLSVPGRRQERGEPQTNPGRAFLCLQALGLEKSLCENRAPAPERANSLLLLADMRRLLDYLKTREQGYGSALAFHLANALFQTACRFDELIQLTWPNENIRVTRGKVALNVAFMQ
jgi:integrase